MTGFNRRDFIKLSAAGVITLASGQVPEIAQIPKGLHREYQLAELATRAPSSHNTQPWRIQISAGLIEILPDYTRRCPQIDPHNHHLWISLGCATENIMLAAADFGLMPSLSIDDERIRIRLSADPDAKANALSRLITSRQSTRCHYQRQPVSGSWLTLLQKSARTENVDTLVLMDGAQRQVAEELVLTASDAQLAQAEIRQELLHWLRFNRQEAQEHGDGLFSACSGNPQMPGWLGPLVFDWVYTAKNERIRLGEALKSASGLILLHASQSNPQQWIESGRCVQRLALQLTGLGLKMAFINQPVEVPACRMQLAEQLNLEGRHPEMLLRFGFANPMPDSFRRPLSEVCQPVQASPFSIDDAAKPVKCCARVATGSL